MAHVICPDKIMDFSKISLPRQTGIRQIKETGKHNARNLGSKALAINENIDATKTAQPATFVTGTVS